MAKIAVTILTGFLGSGKTTLLGELLAQNDSNDIAVIVNELGKEGLDHKIINALYVKEQTVLLNAGCMCCNRRTDLIEKLRELLDSYQLNNKPLKRIIIETTGLANPAPILFTLLSDPFLSNHFDIQSVVTCVDCINGISHLKNNEEARNQVIFADIVVLTKSDIQKDNENLVQEILSLDPSAVVLDKQKLELKSIFEIKHKDTNVGFSGTNELHNTQIRSLSISFTKPLDWSAFGIWLSMLLYKYGSSILRVKGLLDIGESFLVSINGVGHVIHPPTHIEQNLKADKLTSQSSKLVFIAKNLQMEQILKSLEAFSQILGAKPHIEVIG